MWPILSSAIWMTLKLTGPSSRSLIKHTFMKNRLAQTFAILSTGLLADVFYYGTFTVVPAFYEVPVEVHLKYRVALMDHNAVSVQSLTAIAILTPVWLAFVSRHSRPMRMYAVFAAAAALLSILTTRFGNV